MSEKQNKDATADSRGSRASALDGISRLVAVTLLLIASVTVYGGTSWRFVVGVILLAAACLVVSVADR